MKKDKVLETVNDLPQEFELELLIQKLIFIDSIEEGIKQAELGHVIPHSVVEEEISDGKN
jgi:predicted transcriptional regulator